MIVFFFENFERKSSILVSALKKKAAKKAGKNFNFFLKILFWFEFFLFWGPFCFWDRPQQKKNERKLIDEA